MRVLISGSPTTTHFHHSIWLTLSRVRTSFFESSTVQITSAVFTCPPILGFRVEGLGFSVFNRQDDVCRLHLPTHSEFVCRFSEAAHLCKPTVTDKNDNKSCKKSTTRARNRQSQLNTSPGGKPQRHTQMCMNKKNDHAQKRQLRLSKTTDTG